MNIMDYFFNGGGSVDIGRGPVRSGPITREPLQPRGIPEDNTGLFSPKLSMNNPSVNEMRNNYNDIVSDAPSWSFEARENLRNQIFKQVGSNRGTDEQAQKLAGLDTGFDYLTGLPTSDQGGGWMQYMPSMEDEMLKWELDNKYGKFGIGLGEDQATFNWSIPTPKWLGG